MTNNMEKQQNSNINYNKVIKIKLVKREQPLIEELPLNLNSGLYAQLSQNNKAQYTGLSLKMLEEYISEFFYKKAEKESKPGINGTPFKLNFK